MCQSLYLFLAIASIAYATVKIKYSHFKIKILKVFHCIIFTIFFLTNPILLWPLHTDDIIVMLPLPTLAQKGGLTLQELFISFILSVMADIVCHFICKWLDRDD